MFSSIIEHVLDILYLLFNLLLLLSPLFAYIICSYILWQGYFVTSKAITPSLISI